MSERLAGMPRAWGRNPTETSRFRQRGAAFWTFTILTAVFAALAAFSLGRMIAGPNAPYILLGIVAWVIWMLVGAWLVGLVDVYRRVPWSINLAMLAWGAFPAVFIAGQLEGVVPPIFGSGYTTAMTAGLFEEAMKLLGVILLAATVPLLFRRPMGALICAMMAGLGFSFYENLGYTYAPLSELGANAGATEKIGTVLQMFVIRGFVDEVFAHLVFTGVAAMGVVYFLSRTDLSRGRRLGVPILLFLAAALMHFCNDMPLAESGVGAVANNVLQIGVLIWLIVHAVRVERGWLPGAAAGNQPVIESEEVGTLRTRRTRRHARATVPDRAARRRAKTRQWAQIGYVDALDEEAGSTQTERLASYVAILREPAGTGRIPSQRFPETDEGRTDEARTGEVTDAGQAEESRRTDGRHRTTESPG